MRRSSDLLCHRSKATAVCVALATSVFWLGGASALAKPTGPAKGVAGIVWNDVKPADAWARKAINYVGARHDWMRDFKASPDGTYRFRPARLETRQSLARAVVKAFAPAEVPDPAIIFSDLAPSSAFYPYANVAVKLGWMGINAKGNFNGDATVTVVYLHRVLIRALGLRATADSIDALHMTKGTPFKTPKNLGSTTLGMRLGLRYNSSDESKDVLPTTELPRSQVAYSLYRASTLDPWMVSDLDEQYADMTLPNMVPVRQALVEWGMKYVGYPYIWGGEWGFRSQEPGALGGQPIAGFDCSGLAWWVLRSNDGGAWNVAPPRPYGGWNLAQRVAADQAAGGPSISYKTLKPGDLMFYDGEGNGQIDHVDVYIGNGWALDSSSSVGGVSIMWVGDGWYHDHFVHGRRLI
jgi:cell wall-associated NlpC family hydrolase